MNLGRHRFKAPQEDGAVSATPDLEEAPALVERNRSLLSCDGRFSALRKQARAELRSVAHEYLVAFTDSPSTPADPSAPLILSGHQPEFFHPGVWYKNFALAQVARSHNATAVNLVIDNDTVGAPAIRTPAGDLSHPTVEPVLFDRPAEPIPFEERAILDPDLFASFASRATQQIAPFVANPLVEDLWPLATEAAKRTGNLGLAAAQARRLFEERFGVRTLEAPQSAVCDTAAFVEFAWELLDRAGRLAEIYNACLADYREAHRIRSRSHPVPDLAVEEEWVEAPFWIWSTDRPLRQRLFVRSVANGLELTDRAKVRFTAPSREALHSYLSESNIKVRSRALVTTMYARLILSDLFIHGVGGAKYDELTDAIVRRFFNLEPPGYLTVTATRHLPIPLPQVSAEDLTRLDQSLRKMKYHPETFVNTTDAQELIAEKRRWIDVTAADQLPERHQAIERINQDLQRYIAADQASLLKQRPRLQHELSVKRRLGSREFSFVLFPEERLRSFFPV